MITADCPEAREEVIWIAFFDHLHDTGQSNLLARAADNPAFETPCREHIRKLLAGRGKGRYLSKGAYNLTRIADLHKLIPDARLVLPLRDPVWHIASLIKLHRLFCAGQRGNKRAVDFMRRAGHFGFGLDLRPTNTGNDEMVREIQALWDCGEEVRGRARYWAIIYGHVADVLERNPTLREANITLPYEDMCDRPKGTMRRATEHCGVDIDDEVLARIAGHLKRPDYCRPELSDRQPTIIENETKSISQSLK